MANQTISVNTNHDALTGRLAGEDITINAGSILTIDSMPHLTAMGILGDLQINDGILDIDGRNVKEVAYSAGSGTIPAVGASISWAGGAGSGKVIRLNSGNNVAGVLTLTLQSGAVPSGTITSGGWSATVGSQKVGYLIVYGEDQIWDANDARATLRIRGDWYELGTGNGASSQVFNLPHAGVQWAVWVETGNGTNVYEIWHRVPTNQVSTAFFNSPAEFGGNYESGFVFTNAPRATTITFGTAAAGGAPLNGARIRIPNVHIGTTTVGAPSTEEISATATLYLEIIDSNVNQNVEIDHLNASTASINFVGTNNTTITDSCWGVRQANAINAVNATTTISNCYLGSGSGLTNDLPVTSILFTTNVGTINMANCVLCAGLNSASNQVLTLNNISGLNMTGRTKIVCNVKNLATLATIRGSVAVNLDIEELININGTLVPGFGCANWTIDNFKFGLSTNRPAATENLPFISMSGCTNIYILGGNKASGCKMGTASFANISGADKVVIRNFGTITSKVASENRLNPVVSLTSNTTNVKLQRLWFTNVNTTQSYQVVSTCKNITIENCSGDYTEEIELDAINCLCKGLHGADNIPENAAGVEGDLVNTLGTLFLDYFKSDTTGALGLVFNDPDDFLAANVTFTAGTPIFNGLGQLYMRTTGDQVVFEWPYSIRGHTSFQNAAPQTAANIGTYTYEYQLDTGSGYGIWKTVSGANLSGETISPAGFKFKVRITAATTGTTQWLKGFAILTNTTLTAQNNNLYPLDPVTVKVTVLDAVTKLPVSGARVFLYTDPGGVEIFNTTTDVSGIVQNTGYAYTSNQLVAGRVRKGTSGTFYKTADIAGTITAAGLDLTIFVIPDQ